MGKIQFGGPGEIALAEEKCPMDCFENHIRKIGVVTACEWFGHAADSEFVKETVAILIERSNYK